MGDMQMFDGFPAIHAGVYRTEAGTPYLKSPGVVMTAKPNINFEGLRAFLEGFGEELKFAQYLDDPVELDEATQLVKTAGQCCYASFSPKRTMNESAQRYIDNLVGSGHGSVLEHATFSFMLYGISRSNTHEVVRHRAGAAYSQLSQRYVSGRVLRFVERPEYQSLPELHRQFEERIDRAAADYESIANYLQEQQGIGEVAILTAEAKTDLRKKVQQTARSVLPNETETFMTMTANVRAWRHMIEMRANEHAETEIRALFFRIFLCLREVAPILFNDYRVITLHDGTSAVETDWRKV